MEVWQIIHLMFKRTVGFPPPKRGMEVFWHLKLTYCALTRSLCRLHSQLVRINYTVMYQLRTFFQFSV